MDPEGCSFWGFSMEVGWLVGWSVVCFVLLCIALFCFVLSAFVVINGVSLGVKSDWSKKTLLFQYSLGDLGD